MPGFIFYEGASRIDRKPIVGIATYGTANAKTGDLVQTWILRSDIHPIDSINTGADESICGSCPLRGRIADASERTHKATKFPGETVNKGRSCYVLVQNAPLQIFNGYKRGLYPVLGLEHRHLLLGRGLRYGSYGDPVAIPMKSWDVLAELCTGKAEPGYTHQWKIKKFSNWSKRIMASTHSAGENAVAQAAGWRTFRTITDVSEKVDNEIICPASVEGGFRATCETCGACNGRRDISDVRANVAIVAHGGDGKLNLVREAIEKSGSKYVLSVLKS